ncbi:hypothetical protein O181_099390, partial [Austropuccinia psidii MF-1]|nr:hypothetical protein [Austropuccinia psidii MF-1]
MLVMLADNHTRNACSLSNPSNHAARGVPDQDALTRTPLWLTMRRAFPSRNGCREQFWMISPVPSSIDLSTPLLGHHPMVTSLLDQSELIIRPMKDGNGERTFKLGPIVTMSCHPWDSNAKVKKNQPNPPQQDSPVPSFPHEQTPQQPTPSPSGNQCELTVPPFVEHSRTNEPPIPGPSPSSKPHEDILTHELEPE